MPSRARARVRALLRHALPASAAGGGEASGVRASLSAASSDAATLLSATEFVNHGVRALRGSLIDPVEATLSLGAPLQRVLDAVVGVVQGRASLRDVERAVRALPADKLERVAQVLTAVLLGAVFARVPRARHAIATLATAVGQLSLFGGQIDMLQRVLKGAGKEQVVTPAYALTTVLGYAMLTLGNVHLRHTSEGKLLLVTNVASTLIFAAVAYVVLVVNRELPPPASGVAEDARARGTDAVMDAQTRALLATFAAASFSWLMWVLPMLRGQLAGEAGRGAVPSTIGSLLLAGGTIDAAATAALSGAEVMPASSSSRIARGLIWLWLGTWAIRDTAPGRVLFGMLAYNTTLFQIIWRAGARAVAERTKAIRASRARVRSVAQQLSSGERAAGTGASPSAAERAIATAVPTFAAPARGSAESESDSDSDDDDDSASSSSTGGDTASDASA